MIKITRTSDLNRVFTFGGWRHAAELEKELTPISDPKDVPLKVNYPTSRRMYVKEEYVSPTTGKRWKNVHAFALSAETNVSSTPFSFFELFVTHYVPVNHSHSLIDCPVDLEYLRNNGVQLWGVYVLPRDWDARTEKQKIVWLFNNSSDSTKIFRFDDNMYISREDFIKFLVDARYGYSRNGAVKTYPNGVYWLESKQIL